MATRGILRYINLFVIVFMSIMAGCSSGQSNLKTNVNSSDSSKVEGKVTIEFWNGHTGPDGKVMASLVKDFEQSHPNIQINIQSLPWDELFTKAQLAIKSGSGPDLVTMPFDRMISYKDSMFKPIDDLVKGNINMADFDKNLWSKTLFDGKQYGIPLDTHPYVLYYRPDLFKKAGLELLPKDRPITKEEFEKDAKALTSDTVKGFAFKQTAIHSFWDFWGFFLQNGGTLYNSDQTKSEFNSKAAKETLQYLISLQDDKKVVPEGVMDWKTAFSRFNEGSVAMLLHGSWLIPALEESKTPYETAMVPQLGSGDYAAFANMHVFAFTRSDEVKTKAAMEFVQWVETTENAAKWGMGSGNVPAQLKAREKYAENPKLQPIAKTAEMMKGKLFMNPYNKKGDTMIYKYIVPSLEGVYSKTMTIDQALGNIDKGINESLK
ncbi:MAG: transporter substrate-binding protein [Bacilli bacterium]|nr:transporter substrate-binding protein [Bacilli bacterium]